MPDQTANLELPFILQSQAQKHVPHNEALQKLDGIVQLAIAGFRDAPPEAPIEGITYGIGAVPSGEWVAAAGMIAMWQDGIWNFVAPRRGWLAWHTDEERLYVHDGANWRAFGTLGTLPMLGINATPDATNRLALSSESTLFSHAGGSHRLKINKADASDTASILFQSDWSGRAEIGLTGSGRLSVKISTDGTTWTEALTVTDTGHLATPQRPIARAHLSAGTFSPSDGSNTGFSSLALAAGGFSLGDAIAGGTGNRLVVPVDGDYEIHLTVLTLDTGPSKTSVVVNGNDVVADTGAVVSIGAGRKITTVAMARLQKDDWICFRHEGSASLQFGYNATELQMVALS
ncbi:DUF2793 domain-containing protein [Sinorhizobium sp. BG8]|uniref:DUF2793 domain-containing protein n=1 Tax=Sinorhizobium sp. BG8 TaxID=2613773 RepID=UPI00193DFF20|nr:DUF2793 domain-containing protein [Sinorhizobium sp. BG8]